MNESTANQTLDIEGTINTYTKVLWKVGWAVAFVGLGIFLWLQMESSWSDIESNSMYLTCALLSFIIAPFVAFCEHTYTYMDFTHRQIVTVKHRAWCETSKRCRPLTDFSNIVVRHLCHPGGEGPDTYTGSVGLKPVDGRAALWVKSFPTTQDEVARAAYEFARKLQEMTGLPVAATAEFKNETHRN